MLTLGGSQVEVQRCSLSSEGPRLRSSGAQCAQTLAVEVQQCPLRAEVGEEIGDELARRKRTWKLMQTWSRRNWRRRGGGGGGGGGGRTALIKSNNPHLAGGEKYCNYLGRDSNLEFALPFAIGVPLELSCQPKRRPGTAISKTSNANTYCYVYIYIPSIAVYLGSTYTLIYT